MPITLDDKNDAPQLASAVIEAFKKLPSVYTEVKLKELFTPESPENQKLIQEAIEGIKKLSGAKINARGSYVKISKYLHQAIPNKAVLEKLFPVFLEGDFKDLSKATGTDFAARQTVNKAVLAAATTISTQLGQALAAAGKLNDALTAAEAAAKTAAPAGAVPPAGAVATPAVAEAFIRSFDLSKRLYEAGFITRSEYTAKLLETKRLLKEADPPAGPPPLTGTAQPNAPTAPPPLAGTAQPNATGTGTLPAGGAPPATGTPPAGGATPEAIDARKKLGEFVAGMGGDKGLAKVELMPLVEKIKAAYTKYAAEKAIVESHRRLVKAQVKHKILREAKRQGVKKEMLNEFLLAMLGGLIAAVSGWIGKKFGEWFKGGAAVTVVPVGPGAGVDHSKELDAALAAVAAAESGYQGPDGEHGPDGKLFDRTKSLGSVTLLQGKLTEAQAKLEALIAACPEGTAAAAAYPDPSGKAVVDALKLAISSKVEMAPLVAALKNMFTYLSS